MYANMNIELIKLVLVTVVQGRGAIFSHSDNMLTLITTSKKAKGSS